MKKAVRNITLLAFSALVMLSVRAAAQREPWMEAPPTSTGLEIGKKIPPFQLRDQNGAVKTFESLRGPNGLAIYFIRSADW